jgi:hypothetical protein
MLKKVINLYKEIIKNMQTPINQFQVQYSEELFASKDFKDLLKNLQINIETYQAYFFARKMDIEDMMR